MSKGNRIPAEQSEGFNTWRLPAVEEGNIIGVEATRPRPDAAPADEPDRVLYTTITAGQLEKITQEAYDEGREQGYSDGLEEGRRKGHEQGLASGRQAARAELNDHLARLQGVLAELLDPLADQRDTLEQALVTLAGEMGRALAQRELSVDAAALRAVVAEAVAALPVGTQQLRVLLNPADRELLRQAPLPGDWQLVDDPAITAGGCRVEGGHSLVDFTLESRVRELVDALLQRDAAPPSPGLGDG